MKNAKMHLQQHIAYPATKQELVAACNKMEDFSMEDKKWFEEHLPEGKYKSAEEVMSALGMDQKAKMYA